MSKPELHEVDVNDLTLEQVVAFMGKVSEAFPQVAKMLNITPHEHKFSIMKWCGFEGWQFMGATGRQKKFNTIEEAIKVRAELIAGGKWQSDIKIVIDMTEEL